MKKLFALILIVAVVVSVFAGCNFRTTPGGTPYDTGYNGTNGNYGMNGNNVTRNNYYPTTTGNVYSGTNGTGNMGATNVR